jgi:hypothetical protein
MPGIPPEPPDWALRSADAPFTPHRPKTMRPRRFGNPPSVRRRESRGAVWRCRPHLTRTLRQRQPGARRPGGHGGIRSRWATLRLRAPTEIVESAGERAGPSRRPAPGGEAGRNGRQSEPSLPDADGSRLTRRPRRTRAPFAALCPRGGARPISRAAGRASTHRMEPTPDCAARADSCGWASPALRNRRWVAGGMAIREGEIRGFPRHHPCSRLMLRFSLG